MSSCPFCSLEANCKWIENDHAIAFPDAFPVTDGHTLVIPRKHVSSIYELTAEEQSALWSLVVEVRNRLLTGLKPDGFNIAVKNGLAAGQTIEHAHVHVIPRRNGDVPDPRGGIRWIIDDKANYWAGDLLGETLDLREFLFGTGRKALAVVRPLLMDLQHGQCFYCGNNVKSDGGHVDHVVPVVEIPD